MPSSESSAFICCKSQLRISWPILVLQVPGEPNESSRASTLVQVEAGRRLTPACDLYHTGSDYGLRASPCAGIPKRFEERSFAATQPACGRRLPPRIGRTARVSLWIALFSF